MQLEHRALRPVEIRAKVDSRTFEAVVLTYNVVDDYDTIFDPKCFAASLETRMPRITWAHDWTEPLGRYVDYKDTDETLTLIGEFDDFDAVPMARRAHAQLVSGTIDNFSVGFGPQDTYKDDNERTHFRTARLDETALVLAGAVPGTKLVSVRSKLGRTAVPEELVISLGKQMAAGELTYDEAVATLQLASGEAPAAPSVPTHTSEVVSASDPAIEAADELLDALLP